MQAMWANVTYAASGRGKSHIRSLVLVGAQTMTRSITNHRLLVFALSAVIATMSVSSMAQTASWIAPVATASGTVTNQWNTTSNWSTGSVPNSAGATVTFSGSYATGVNNVQLLGSATTTIGTLNMTSLSVNGKLNFSATSGTAFLRLDSGSATQPVINYTNGSQFDNFMNVQLTGTQGFEKTGAGVIQLGVTNSYTGTTRITAGGVRFGSNSQLGDPSASIALNGGTLFLRTNSGGVALDNRAAFGDAPGATRRNIAVLGTGTSRIQVEPSSLLEITGTFTSTAGSVFRKTDTGTLAIRGSSNTFSGVFEHDGGVLNVTGSIASSQNFVVAKAASGTATLNWSGTGTVAAANFMGFYLNDSGTTSTGVLNVTAGTLNVGNGSVSTRLAIGGKGSGIATVTGGTLAMPNAAELSIGSFSQFGGSNGSGTLNINGGLVRVSGSGAFYVGYGQDNTGPGGTAFGGRGVLNLNTGGVLETDRSIRTGLSGTLASGTFNFNGGTLRALATSTNFVAVTTANVQNGGAVIDTNAFDVTIAQALQNAGSGGLTKVGLGTLTLTASNSYAGSTAVNGGTLKAGNANAFGSSGVTVASNATLDLNGLAIGSAITNNGGTVSNAASYAGSQTLNGASAIGDLGGTLVVANGGNATFGGALAAATTINAGGNGTLNNAGSITAASLANNGTFTIDRTGTSSLATVFSGNGTLVKAGAGVVTLSGSSSFSGATQVNAGDLRVDGSLAGGVAVAAGAILGGAGSVGTVSGAGLVGPGNSPGILTATDVNPSGGLSFAFEFTQAAPNYGTPSNVGNDLFWLTGGTPFTTALSGSNTVSIYMTPAAAELGTLTGGFYTNNAVDFLANINSASFQYYVADANGSVTYNGQTYTTLTEYDSSKSVTISTVGANGGQVMQMVVVPEPGALAIVATGALAAGWTTLRRIRRR
jgi:fibronectin-binding autotransporter adhesin